MDYPLDPRKSRLGGLSERSGARFMGPWERWRLLNPHHTGLLVDGHRRRLSPKVSFESVVTVGGMGRGKSSTFVIPNLLTLEGASCVVTDTSGEIYQRTSGHLARQGYRIRVLNLMDPSQSEQYNPLAQARDYTRIAQSAEILIRSAFQDQSHDPFWNTGAEKLLRIFIQCLHNQGDPALVNLANLKHLIAHFDAHLAPPGQLGRIDRFVMDATTHDPATFADYQGFTVGNPKTLLSFVSTADAALNALGNPELARLTAASTLDFQELRDHKTVLYVLVHQQELRFYQFLLNLFYTDLFNALLSNLTPSGLPVYLLLDEFGHLTLPGFEVFATTARKYRVGFWVFLQSLSQLESRYGARHAETILDGLQTEIYLPGVNLETAQRLERRLGRTARSEQGSRALMSADEIIRMKDDQALLLYSNKRPVALTTRPYYKQWGLRARAGIAPVPMVAAARAPLRFVTL